MNQSSLILTSALVFGGVLLVALLVWAVWVRPFAKRMGARTFSPYSLEALLGDFAASLVYSRGRGPLPWFLKLFGALLVVLTSVVVFIVMVLVFRLGT